MKHNTRKPDWLKIKLPQGENFIKVNRIIKEHKLHTICTSGKCPNQAECWKNGTATFMILGNICTRNCKFCAVTHKTPFPPNPLEPQKIAESVQLLSLKHCVITSVNRDDLEDYGANHWAETIRKTKELNKNTTLEVLIPDFNGNKKFIDLVIKEEPEVISHNLETVRRLTPQIRSRANYEMSLEVLRYISKSNLRSKSGLMLGIGETMAEIEETMDDLIAAGVEILTLGQYLRPSKEHLELKEFVPIQKFKELKEIGLSKGFRFVESGPFVRSSYHAEKHVV